MFALPRELWPLAPGQGNSRVEVELMAGWTEPSLGAVGTVTGVIEVLGKGMASIKNIVKII
jgi:hypothetical protein